MDTVVVAVLETPAGANYVADLLRANDIHCEVEHRWPIIGSMMALAPSAWDRGSHSVLVAKEDEARAREALQGVFASEWFLRAPDGRSYHSFEAATVEVLRHHVASHPDTDDFSIRDVTHLADLLVANGWHTVYQAFHHHRLHPHRLDPLEGRSLDEWARACGCAHVHTHLENE
jgi:hypothetical protein